MKLPDTTRRLIHDTAEKLEAVYNEHSKEFFNYDDDKINAYVLRLAGIIKEFRRNANTFDLEFAEMDKHTEIDFKYIKDMEMMVKLFG